MTRIPVLMQSRMSLHAANCTFAFILHGGISLPPEPELGVIFCQNMQGCGLNG